MRRMEREITDLVELESIIAACQVCRIALCDGNMPYIVPMNFGYQEHCLYLHAAKEGKKIDLIKKNPNVCFEMDTDHVLVTNEVDCKWTMHYKSVIGNGVAEIITDNAEKEKGLQIIMKQYAGERTFKFIPKVMDMMSLIKIPISDMTGKKSGN
jgi:nitroimidazol reductase NimA-like FMN-containing flavoprotein (pyridoxamine 5'-phosphate oxidase superfamily)